MVWGEGHEGSIVSFYIRKCTAFLKNFARCSGEIYFESYIASLKMLYSLRVTHVQIWVKSCALYKKWSFLVVQKKKINNICHPNLFQVIYEKATNCYINYWNENSSFSFLNDVCGGVSRPFHYSSSSRVIWNNSKDTRGYRTLFLPCGSWLLWWRRLRCDKRTL